MTSKRKGGKSAHLDRSTQKVSSSSDRYNDGFNNTPTIVPQTKEFIHLPGSADQIRGRRTVPMNFPYIFSVQTTTRATAGSPLPPNWNEHLEETIASLAPYKLFPIANDTLEYATVTAMLDPFKIIAAEQIVNPSLWSRFVNTRRYMLLTKSDDLNLISKLASAEKQIRQQMHISLNFPKDAEVAAYPYNDNMALLFHCTRSAANVDSILVQGLDERLGNGGRFGKGIYFADNPMKSMGYDGTGGTIFICMVLLGDCLSVNHLNNRATFVREPEKQQVQQRNLNDIHFDSIVGRPDTYNEYVVYNRYQCCPIYKIRFASNSSHGSNIYLESRNFLPPFSWLPHTSGSIAMPTQSTNVDWSFYAKNIFTQMGVQEEDIDSEIEILESTESIENKLTILTNLGFMNAEMNLEALKKNSYNLDRSVNHLLELGAMPDQPSESQILHNNKLSMLSTLGFTDAEMNSETLNENSFDFDRKVKLLLGLSDSSVQPSECQVLCKTSNDSTDVPGPGPSSSEVKISESAESIVNKLTILTNLGFMNVEQNLEALKKNLYDLDESVNHLLELGVMTQSTEPEILINNKLSILLELGFMDTELNVQTLKKNSYDLEKSVNHLLGLGNNLHGHPSESQIFNKQLDQAGPERSTCFMEIVYDYDSEIRNELEKVATTTSTAVAQLDECLICSNEYELAAINWNVLQCSHKICTLCYKQIEKTRTTMGGVTQTFIKCPFCMETFGVEIGTCPDGTMQICVMPTSCEGYEKYESISIKYVINHPLYGLSRTAYLPNNDEGKEVLKLLQIAWDRRLCFTIGTSGTTGQQNVLIWNIHHKTAQQGGVQCHGFPDDTYIRRAKLELKAYGIE